MNKTLWQPFHQLEQVLDIDLGYKPPLSFDIKPILSHAKRDLKSSRSRLNAYKPRRPPSVKAIAQFDPADIPQDVIDSASADVERRKLELSVISSAYDAARRREKDKRVRGQFEKTLLSNARRLTRLMYQEQPKKKNFKPGESPPANYPKSRLLANEPLVIREENGSFHIRVYMEKREYKVSHGSMAVGVDLDGRWEWKESMQTMIYVDWNRSMLYPNAPKQELGGFWGVVDTVGSFLAEEVITTILLAGVGKVALLTARGARLAYKGVRGARAVQLSRGAWASMHKSWRTILGKFNTRASSGARPAASPTQGASQAASRGGQATARSGSGSRAASGESLSQVGGRGAAETVEQVLKRTADDFVYEVQEAAARRALDDAVFVNHLRRGTSGLTNAGTRFHTIAKETAESMANQLPEGFEVIAERAFRTATGAIKRPDLLIRNSRTRQIFQYDWKTKSLSEINAGSRAVDKAVATADAAKLGSPGFTVASNESRNWAPAVSRALARHPNRDQLIPLVAEALGTKELSRAALRNISTRIERAFRDYYD